MIKIALTPKSGAFTALRAYANENLIINTMGGAGTWQGMATGVEIKAVGVEGSEFICVVQGDFQHNSVYVLDSNGRCDVKLP